MDSKDSRKTEWGITHEEKHGERTVVWVDTKKVRYFYKGQVWQCKQMNRFLRRKFENRLFLSRPKEFLIVKYE